jgi:hypothetical protein
MKRRDFLRVVAATSFTAVGVTNAADEAITVYKSST